MTRSRTRALMAGAILAAAAAGSAATAGLMRAQDDSRQPIPVTAMQRDHMLAEMRGLLTSVNGVLRGVATRDTALMRASAAAAGMAAMQAQMQGRGMGRGMGMGPAMRDSMMARGMAPGAMRDSMMAHGMAPGAMRDSMMRRDSAMPRGMGPGAGMGVGMGARRPEAFRQLGMGTHLAFDSLAATITDGAGRDTVIGRMAGITSNCVSCHSMYRLEVR